MARVVLSSALARWMKAADGGEIALAVAGTTLLDVLEQLFRAHPSLRGYVLDDRGAIRHHVAVFVDGRAHRDKTRLDVPVAPDAEIHLLQALSGG